MGMFIFIFKKKIFCVSYWDFPDHGALYYPLGTIRKKSQLLGVHWGGFIMFRPRAQKLLNIE
jgi:hypothetical protein